MFHQDEKEYTYRIRIKAGTNVGASKNGRDGRCIQTGNRAGTYGPGAYSRGQGIRGDSARARDSDATPCEVGLDEIDKGGLGQTRHRLRRPGHGLCERCILEGSCMKVLEQKLVVGVDSLLSCAKIRFLSESIFKYLAHGPDRNKNKINNIRHAPPQSQPERQLSPRQHPHL